MLSHPTGKKAGSNKGVKRNPSYYLNFTAKSVAPHVIVSYSVATKIYDHGEEKDKTVVNAAIDSGLLAAAESIGRQFIIYAYNNNGYTPD